MANSEIDPLDALEKGIRVVDVEIADESINDSWDKNIPKWRIVSERTGKPPSEIKFRSAKSLEFKLKKIKRQKQRKIENKENNL